MNSCGLITIAFAVVVSMAASCAQSAVAVVQSGAIIVYVNDASALPITIKALGELRNSDDRIMDASVTQMPRHRQILLLHELLEFNAADSANAASDASLDDWCSWAIAEDSAKYSS